MRQDHHIDEIVRHAPRRDHEADPPQAEDEEEFRRPQRPCGAYRPYNDVRTENTDQEWDEQADVKMAECEITVAYMVGAVETEQIDGNRETQADHNGAR